MENLRPPREMSLEGVVVCNFRRWKQQFTIFMEASGAADSTEMSNKKKAAILLHTIGPEVQGICNTLEVPETTKKDCKNLLDYLEHHFKPKENETINRHQFHTRKQKERYNGFAIDVVGVTTLPCQIRDVKKGK
ncbi:hypothetical protein QE152_g11056 [Popillia japonica]|uniref:Uncharacterized protein n=1 Tax=Popillia japonica TaxID=7064 RepID=A0AAW1LSY8_POPJA